MKVILLMHMNNLQQFTHSWWGVTILSIVLITLLVIGLLIAAIGNEANPVPSFIGAVISLSSIIPLVMLIFTKSNINPNPRADTAYSSNATVEWKNNSSDHVYGINFQGKYYHDDYLCIDGTNVKIAKTHWTNKEQTITPLNSTGRAWMTVAKKIQAQPKPHAYIEMDVHLSYTKGSVDTPEGTKKFVCYVNNKHPNDNKDYQVLQYK